MTDKEAKDLADKILKNSLTCWKPYKDCKNTYNHNDVIQLAKWVKEQNK